MDSDVDEPNPKQENEYESEEDVVVLGVKKPTYQEITLEEDDDGDVKESVIEKEKSPDKKIKKHLFECQYCDKSFRLESLLIFHEKMHGTVMSPTNSNTSNSLLAQSNLNSENSLDTFNKPKKKRHLSETKEDDEQKVHIESSHQAKKKKKRKKHKRSKLISVI